MKRPQVDVGFAYAAHALARRAEEVHVRLAANGVECASRFEIAGRSGRLATWGGRTPALVEPGRAVADSAIRGTARAEPVLRRWSAPGGESTARESMARTEPALPVWRGTIAGPASSAAAPATNQTSRTTKCDQAGADSIELAAPPNVMAPTEPALPVWRGTIAGPASSTGALATNETLRASKPDQISADSVEPAPADGIALTEPALPTWRGTVATADTRATSEPPRTSGLVIIRGPLTRGRR